MLIRAGHSFSSQNWLRDRVSQVKNYNPNLRLSREIITFASVGTYSGYWSYQAYGFYGYWKKMHRGRRIELFYFSSVLVFKRQVSVRCGARGYIPSYFSAQSRGLFDSRSSRPDWQHSEPLSQANSQQSGILKLYYVLGIYQTIFF